MDGHEALEAGLDKTDVFALLKEAPAALDHIRLYNAQPRMIKGLCAALEKNNTLLSLKFDALSLKGCLSPLFEALQKNTSIQNLRLSSLNLNGEDILAFTDYILKSTSLRRLDLHFNRVDGLEFAPFLESLGENSGMTHLTIESVDMDACFLQALCKGLSGAKAIESLVLEDFVVPNLLAGSLMDAIGKISSLKTLKMIGGNFKEDIDSGLAKLVRSSTQLSKLVLNGCRSKEEEPLFFTVTALAESKSLRSLKIWDMLSYQVATRLFSWLKWNSSNLEHLDISGDDSKMCNSIESVVKYWEVVNGFSDSFRNYIVDNICLKTLKMNYMDFKKKMSDALGDALSSDAVLTHLDLKCANISAGGFEKIAEGLEKNSTLTHLNLAGTLKFNLGKYPSDSLDDLNHPKEVFDTVCRALRVNKSLQFVDLESCVFPPQKFADLANVIEDRPQPLKIKPPCCLYVDREEIGVLKRAMRNAEERLEEPPLKRKA